MSEISAEEKRRLLRERRQAKMNSGKATERLNNILTQGSSVKSASAVSVLDQPKETEAPQPTIPVTHDDPEVPDISSLLPSNDGLGGEANDLDAMFQKIFSGGAPGSSDGPEGSNFFAETMKALAEGQGDMPNAGPENSYRNDAGAYQVYEQKKWKARFLVVRWVIHVFNFVYHYRNHVLFRSSPYYLVRGIAPFESKNNFMTAFLSAEVVIISSYFFIMSSNGLLQASSQNNIFSKLISMGSAFEPRVLAFKPLVNRMLVYWAVANIFISDVMLIVFLFGLTSVFS